MSGDNDTTWQQTRSPSVKCLEETRLKMVSLIDDNAALLAALEAVARDRDFRVRCNNHLQVMVDRAIASAKANK